MASPSLRRRRSGSSTAQANLAKIIAIIVTVPPPPNSSPNADTNDISSPVNLVDLRLGLTLDASPNQADSADKTFKNGPSSSEGECSPIKHREREISEITNSSCKEEEEEIDGEGYLDLLLEAARRVSGGCGNDAAEDEKRSKRRKKSSPPPSPPPPKPAAVFIEREPIVRSRRGRNQTLPLRYRDSVLEPWRKPPTVFRR